MKNVDYEIRKLVTRWKVRRVLEWIIIPLFGLLGLSLLVFQWLGTTFDNIAYGLTAVIFSIIAPLLYKLEKKQYQKKLNELLKEKEQMKNN